MTIRNAFGGPLTCPACKTVTEGVLPGASTKIIDRYEEGDRVLRVGERIEDLDHLDFEQVYYTVRAIERGERARAIEPWTCPHCGTKGWFVIVYGDDKILEMEAVTLSRALLESLDYLHPDLVEGLPPQERKEVIVADGDRDWVNGRVDPIYFERVASLIERLSG